MGYLKHLVTLLSSLTLVSSQLQAGNATIQGFTKEGIAALNAAMHQWVDDGKGAGVVTLVARHGEIVSHDAYGVLNASAATKTPVEKDSIFSIMSMTKPVVGVSMMMFYEEGKWKLDDPVSKHIPEFADLQVREANGSLVPQKTPMTMAQLMSHSAGFPAQLTVNSSTLQTIIPPLVAGQLAFQPGTDWRYGPGVEIQGYLIEKWAGKDLSDFMEERLFRPLGLKDTGFWVDPCKINRVSALHSAIGGRVTTISSPFGSGIATSKPTRLSPSGGLYSTAEDYWRFSQMVLNGGEFEGTRYLNTSTVKLMHTNVLAEGVAIVNGGVGAARSPGTGFGLDFAIILDGPASKQSMPEGSFYWGGAFGTWFWIDPTDDVVVVGMIQNLGGALSGDGSLREASAKGTYAALQRDACSK
ncbi:beta-lactamase/transpeptidase-like protein [Eremomyces bilateralis CBS 781.70]|uniref:Beta-lactamase/transpeptidase-like protein n=1 Tax=Eremomyces bilateralis CBS 781.70 TaxID=1392243 RepID=A0A6G1GDK6_9PEZI|nr:beta-lactamase/transpeptidase-like protein [Eremomyces bilateralis CBS 781.70]KAF1816177.1 beta-lactamase/transpeptidase-like protein [Eremomyces bilateralis CBS 781.70]